MSERDQNDNPFIRSSPWGRAKGAAPFGYALPPGQPGDQPAGEAASPPRAPEPQAAPRPAVQAPTARPSVVPQGGGAGLCAGSVQFGGVL